MDVLHTCTHSACPRSIATLLSLLICTVSALAQKQEAYPPEAILYVGHLNFDCHVDTVAGWMDDELHYLPHVIRWGSGAEDSCASQTPKVRRERKTEITYPAWKRITGSVSFERMNLEDTLPDIVLYLWGTVESNGRLRDSVRRIVIYAQNALDAVKELNINAMGRFQSDPYFAIELEKETDLTRPAARDLSGVTSYKVMKRSLDVRQRQQPEPSPITGITTPVVHVYPNPAATSAQVEAEQISPGIYSVEVIAVNGMVVLRQEVTVADSQSLYSALDVSRLASGYYLLRLDRKGERALTYPIIITR